MPLRAKLLIGSATTPPGGNSTRWSGIGSKPIPSSRASNECGGFQSPASKQRAGKSFTAGSVGRCLRKQAGRDFQAGGLIMFDDLSDLYQQVILDHCKRPRNFHEMTNPSRSAQGHNPLCGDRLTLFLSMDGEV